LGLKGYVDVVVVELLKTFEPCEKTISMKGKGEITNSFLEVSFTPSLTQVLPQIVVA
jgi:hypothetical protein